MSDYLRRLALRGAGLDAGRPAPAPDLPPVFGPETERTLVDPTAEEIGAAAALAPTAAGAARVVERTDAQQMIAGDGEVDAAVRARHRASAGAAADVEPPALAHAGPPSAAHQPAPAAAPPLALRESSRVADTAPPARTVVTPTNDPGTSPGTARPPIPSSPSRAAASVMTVARSAVWPPQRDWSSVERSNTVEDAALRAAEPAAPLRPSTDPTRILVEPPAPAPLDVPTAAAVGAVEVSVHVGRVVVRQEFAPPLPAPRPADGARSAFAGLSLARRHVDRRWY
jgi:hypothetical protein